MKLGGALQKLKAILNYGAPAIGAATYPTLGTTSAKFENAVARYTGYNASMPGTEAQPLWSTDYCGDAWQGIGTAALFQYVDAKTRHYGNISRKKLLDIVEEAIPVFLAYDRGGSTTAMVTHYNQSTTGYNSASLYGDYQFEHVKPYATAKAVRIGLDIFGVRKWINRRLPKGINI
jgi:hypothetical protein